MLDSKSHGVLNTPDPVISQEKISLSNWWVEYLTTSVIY